MVALGASQPLAVAATSRPLATLTLSVSSTTTAVGRGIRVDVLLRNARDVAGFEIVATVDPSAAVLDGADAKRSSLARDRRFTDLSMSDLTTHTVLAGYLCPTEACVAGEVHASGFDGPLVLGSFYLTPQRAGAVELHVGATRVVDSHGEPISIARGDQAVRVQVGGAATVHVATALPWTFSSHETGSLSVVDLDHNGSVDRYDLELVAEQWQLVRLSRSPCAGVDRTYDVNGDGCLDVGDLVAGADDVRARALGARVPAAPPSNSPFVVNSTGDGADANIGNGQCATTAGTCSLRAAIQEANAKSGPNEIDFNIAGNGVKTISIASKLPTLSDASGPTTIDGYTQPGAAPNAHPTVDNATILIAVQGNASLAYDGFSMISGSNVVRGVSIYSVRRPFWIHGTTAADNVVVGNFIGTNPAGTYVAPIAVDLGHGLHIEQGADDTVVGTPQPADRNVVSGNSRDGIGIFHNGTTHTSIQGNLIGLSPLGDRDLGNTFIGIHIAYGASDSLVGGPDPAERNVVSGNGGFGIKISHTPQTTRNEVQGNFVGTDVTGEAGPGYARNGMSGVILHDGAAGNTVLENVISNNANSGVLITSFGPTNGVTAGNRVFDNWIGESPSGNPMPNLLRGVYIQGTDNIIGPGNRIANNGGAGVRIEDPTAVRNQITQNSITNNVGFGILLGPGGNNMLAAPVVTTAGASTISGTACASCTVEVFLADGKFPTGSGVTYLVSGVATPGGTFSITNSVASVGALITATATDPAKNTSQFSTNVTVG
jgi:CSLREA domain-containing protein